MNQILDWETKVVDLKTKYHLLKNNCATFVQQWLEKAHEISHQTNCGSKGYRHPPRDYGARSSLILSLPVNEDEELPGGAADVVLKFEQSQSGEDEIVVEEVESVLGNWVSRFVGLLNFPLGIRSFFIP